ncbi:response regulator [Paenibacillus arenilitoris]|uniref:Response regulator n=1 Tax=Paenibacillus arenilitoris TaxID=2772299 RepID=A0A927CLB7_9BACL|nr:response regulator [Paenibacillus arenilitoris]MBD2870193.1 response regulator [Paenibacillus arenilitoris]
MAKVLIADSCSNVRFLLHEIMRIEGHEVVASCQSGKEVLQLYSAIRPDIAIMDYDLPEVDGLSAAKQILLSDERAGIVIFVPGAADWKRKAAKLGVSAIIKPFDVEELKREIDGLLGNNRSFATGPDNV